MHKLGILETHPIQYKVPWFRGLSACDDIEVCVYYCMLPDREQQGTGFGVSFEWDIPLLEGYPYEVLENVAARPSLTGFRGCDTPAVRRLVREGRFDAFIVNGWVAKSCLQLLAACRRARVPCIVRGESNTMRPRAGWKRLLHRTLLRRYAAALTIGKANRDFYLRNGVPQERLFPAPYCVDNERFSAAAGEQRQQRDALRSDWSIPRDACVFLFCGKLEPKKRPLDLVLSLDRVVSRRDVRRTDIHVLIAGAGPLLDACRREAAERDLPVSFAGFLNQGEVPKAYAASDCLVLPSDAGETWGLVVNEAMACGLPCIVSDRVGCGPDLVEEKVTGLRFALGDEAVLADCLSTMATDPERRLRMGAAARRRVAGYTWREVVRGTRSALEFVTRDRGEAGCC